jgi:hypothetical protein
LKKIVSALFYYIVIFNANEQVADTAKKAMVNFPDTIQHLHSKKWTYIVPAGLVAYGLASLAITPVRNIDFYIAGRIKTSSPNFNSKIDDYTQVAPIAFVYGLNLVGDYGKNRFVDRTAYWYYQVVF